MRNKILKKEEREKCWSSRDEYFNCLETNNEDKKNCEREWKNFEASCPETWVSKHF